MQRIPDRVRKQSDKNNKYDNYISLPEACKVLFLTESTVRYYIGRHRIRAFKSHGRWYLNKDNVLTLQNWLKSKK
ncbi:helix-turn-helix domain-containing protein [Nostoc sp. DedSLP03]|uniref:helix-turn-helix domain-containing protein n=1 Tax=Nostoc sp. DedSLP03 TaxID=3075400 RepID=UPI003A100734